MLTVIDFLLFKLASQRAHWNRYAANLFSTSVALVLSLLANESIVFHPDHFAAGPGTLRFLLITLASAWGIQNAVLFLLARLPVFESLFRRMEAIAARLPGRADTLLNGLGIHKIVAISCGLIWNFCWYRWWVFA